MPNTMIYEIGETRVARVPDCELDSFAPGDLMPEWRPDLEPLLRAMPETMTLGGQKLLMSIHSWVVWHQGKTVIVDTGVGNDKERPYAPYFNRLKTGYLERLRDLGLSPEDIDCVLHTHLHVDHVGWNTTLTNGQWVPTFPNARHVFSAKEYAFYSDPANRDTRHRTSFQTQLDSVTPIVQAGMAHMIEIDGNEVIPGFRFQSTPGHSVDHASIVLESGRAKAIFAGDVLHHPVQVHAPELLSVFDPERETTLKSRQYVLEMAADDDAMLFSSHFPASSAGFVTRRNGGYEWAFA